LCCRDAASDLKIQRDIEDGRHVGTCGEEVTEVGRNEATLKDDAAGHERVKGYFHLDQDEDCIYKYRDADAGDGDCAGPRHVAAAVEAEDEIESCDDKTESAEEVDLGKLFFPVRVLDFGEIEDKGDCSEGDAANWALTDKASV
jgi:hypothetical protein